MRGTCPVCGSADIEIVGSYRGNHPIFTSLKRVHCRSCGMVNAAPMPQSLVLEEYNASYFDSAHGGQPKGPIAKAFFSGIARLRISYIETYLRNMDILVNSLLEIGPGAGFFARNWLEKRPETNYMAVETDTSCYKSLKDIGVSIAKVPPNSEDNIQVDLVVMSHVLEHVTNPNDFIIHATRNLRQGGALFIEVPCRDWEHKPIDEPHLLFFDKGPMQHLLSKVGFNDIQVSYHGQEIERLRKESVCRAKVMAVRSKLIALGFVAPFARIEQGMEDLADPLERAVVAPFEAHCEKQKPAWWLRALARKS